MTIDNYILCPCYNGYTESADVCQCIYII
jgi:hypothetical protein